MSGFNITDVKEYLDKARRLEAEGKLSPETKAEMKLLTEVIMMNIAREIANDIDGVIRQIEKKRRKQGGKFVFGQNKTISVINIGDKFKGKPLAYFKRLKRLIDREARKQKGG